MLQIKNDFGALLAEQKLDSKAQWRKVRSKIEKDPRCKAVENAQQREDWFKEHIEQLYKVITHYCNSVSSNINGQIITSNY